MNKSIIFFIHLAYWIIYSAFCFSAILITNSLKGIANENSKTLFFLFVIAAIANHYSFYSFLVPHFLARQKVKQFLLCAFGVSLIFAVFILMFQIIFITQQDLGQDAVSENNFSVSVLLTWILSIIFYMAIALIVGFIATLMKGSITWYDEIHIKEVMARRTLETELALLKAQINPHFLFNTLNNIDVLIDRNPVTASIYLKKLSDILRFMLYETQADEIPLSQELEYIAKYIDLQNIRTSNSNFVKYQLSGDVSQLRIAPLIFIPFIENAFKHVANKKVNNAIEISISIHERIIEFHCKNIANFQAVV
jgi:two-component system, LytTR family, sensor kinase